MKKTKSLMLLVVTMLMLAVVFCMNASAAEWKALGDNHQYRLDEETGVMIIRGSADMMSRYCFAVDCYNHYEKDFCSCSDREVDDWPDFSDEQITAKQDAMKTKTLIVQEGVSKLGAGIFANFENVEVVILPQSVTEIPEGAFNSLENLRTVVLSDSTVSIGRGAFYGCTGLKGLYVPDSVKTFGNGAFYGCDPNMIIISETAKKENKGLFMGYIGSFRVGLGKLIASVYGDDFNGCYSKDGIEYYTYDKSKGKYTVIGEGKTWDDEFDINLPTGKIYNFACRYYVENNGKRIYSDYSDIVSYAHAPQMSKVDPKVSDVKDTSFNLSWSKSPNADGYKVYKKLPGKSWETVGTTTKLGGIVKNLKPGTTYQICIRAYAKVEGVVVLADCVCSFTVSTAPEAPSAKVSSPSKGKLTVSWNSVPGAQKYELYYKIGTGKYKLYKTYDSAQNLTFSNLKSGTKYTFAVRAYRTLKTQDDLTKYKVVTTNYYSTYKPLTLTVK